MVKMANRADVSASLEPVKKPSEANLVVEARIGIESDGVVRDHEILRKQAVTQREHVHSVLGRRRLRPAKSNRNCALLPSSTAASRTRKKGPLYAT